MMMMMKFVGISTVALPFLGSVVTASPSSAGATELPVVISEGNASTIFVPLTRKKNQRHVWQDVVPDGTFDSMELFFGYEGWNLAANSDAGPRDRWGCSAFYDAAVPSDNMRVTLFGYGSYHYVKSPYWTTCRPTHATATATTEQELKGTYEGLMECIDKNSEAAMKFGAQGFSWGQKTPCKMYKGDVKIENATKGARKYACKIQFNPFPVAVLSSKVVAVIPKMATHEECFNEVLRSHPEAHAASMAVDAKGTETCSALSDIKTTAIDEDNITTMIAYTNSAIPIPPLPPTTTTEAPATTTWTGSTPTEDPATSTTTAHTATTTGASTTDSSDHEKADVAVILGATAGGIVLLAAVAGAAVWLYHEEPEEEPTEFDTEQGQGDLDCQNAEIQEQIIELDAEMFH